MSSGQTAHLWHLNHTTLLTFVQSLIADQPHNFVRHRLPFSIIEVDCHLVGGGTDTTVHDGGVLAGFLNCTDSYLPFLRIGRNPCYNVECSCLM